MLMVGEAIGRRPDTRAQKTRTGKGEQEHHDESGKRNDRGDALRHPRRYGQPGVVSAYASREAAMRRREFLVSCAAGMAAPQRLDAQRRSAAIATMGRDRIPTGPVARWSFHRLGQGLGEGAAIAGVPDDSGNGCALAINTDSGTSGSKTPIFTNLAINGRGGFWPGTPGVGSAVFKGNFKVTLPALTENNFSVLFCAQMGGNEGNVDAALFSIGGCECWARSGKTNLPKTMFWYNYGTSQGGLRMGDPFNMGAKWAGPVAGGIVNGFNGVGNSTRVMLNRFRQTKTITWNTSTATTAWIGCTPTQAPCAYDCIYHEMAVYNRALTDAELDLWNVYCNQMYGSPLTRSADAYIDRRVVIGTESVDESQGSTYCRTGINLLAQSLGNWNHVEYANYAVGGMTLALYNAAIPASIADMYDSSLGAGDNIFIFGGGSNDVGAGRTAASIWSDSPNGDSIVECLTALRAQGWKIVLCTRSNSE